jgi:penicillin-binding protein 1A
VSLDRKLQEAAMAVRLEANLEKEDILERYLNTVYLGRGAYGMATAADTYFGKRLRELSLGESAFLAGLIQAPGASDPYHDPERATQRRREVLERMVDLGWVSEAAALAADAEARELRPPDENDRVPYPYFTSEVKRRLLDDPALGATRTDRYNALFKGGLRIHTTLDPVVQESAEQAISSILPEDGPAAALAAIDPRSGEVLAIVGGRDWYDPEDPVAQFNLATQGNRQPGSAFKPFVLAAGLEEGLGLEAVFAGGAQAEIPTPSGTWLVENYDGAVFPDIALLEATVFSVNIVYAQLVDVVGPDRVAELASAAGVDQLTPVHSIALGTQEVSVLELASAYGVFAGEGIHVEPVLVRAIETHDGINLYDANPAVTPVLDAAVAREVTAALTEVVRRGTGQQARIGRPIAGKTGTSQKHKDAWFVGYTPEMVAAVWVGFPEATIPMEYPRTPFSITGGTWPAQIWSRFAAGALSGTPYSALETADGSDLITVEVDLSTGFLAGPLCPRAHVQRIRVPSDQVPTVICPIHNPAGVIATERGIVPDVANHTLDAALERLDTAGYIATVEWDEPGPLAPGTVYLQDPPATTALQEGQAVRLIVAGPQPGTVVPPVLGLPEAEAVARLRDAGMTAAVVVEAEADIADAVRRAGLVWSQMPPAGDPKVDEVQLIVNP